MKIISSILFFLLPVLAHAQYDDSLPSITIQDQPTSIRYTDINYIPSNLKSLWDAQRVMNELRDNTRSHSECFQRAHLWNIEMNQMAKIRSEKIFLFFTDKYQREYAFSWWFHVATLVLINDEEFVIDPRFFSSPVNTQEWSNFFMPSHPICKTVTNYQDYDNNQEAEYCYFRKVPMYYFEPRDVEARDENGTVVDHWIDWETASAEDALRRHRRALK